jgi:hypothetical protein
MYISCTQPSIETCTFLSLSGISSIISFLYTSALLYNFNCAETMALNNEQQQFDLYMNNVLGIVQLDVRNALRAQGLTTVNDVTSLSEDDIEDVCKIVRRPGGTIPNPAFGQGARRGAQPPTLPNPGLPIGHLHEKRLKMLRYFVFHLQRVQRDFDPAVATMDILQDVYRLEEVDEEDQKNPSLPDKLMKTEKVREVIENVESVLLNMKGINGVPLLYVFRDQVALPTGIGDDIDEGFGLPTYTQEMIRRAPHTGVYFREAQKTVWSVIRLVTHGGPGWNWVQSFAASQDGRNAFLSMKRYYLGES